MYNLLNNYVAMELHKELYRQVETSRLHHRGKPDRVSIHSKFFCTLGAVLVDWGIKLQTNANNEYQARKQKYLELT
jgi:hypothetical protein